MWIIVMRSPRPDAAVWPGRQGLACLDAVGWPLAAIVLLHRLPFAPGLIVPMAQAIAVLAAGVRLRRAIFQNHRYWFTTWCFGKLLGVGLVLGYVLRWSLAA